MFEAGQEAAWVQRFRLLAEHHVYDIPPRQAELLLWWAVGLNDEEAATAMGVTVQTVMTHSKAVRQRVVPAELPPTHANAQAWALIHRECALAPWWNRLLRHGIP